MKILILSNSASSHTYKWVKSLSEGGCKIYLFSLSKTQNGFYRNVSLAGLEEFDFYKKQTAQFSKINYLRVLPRLKKVIQQFKPDIVHAHYVSSYGMIGALCGFHPLIISVWGSDIYDFPEQSFLHRSMLKYGLKKADKILSTSNCMSKQTNKFTNKRIEITPFGIDLDQFKPMAPEQHLFDDDVVVIGTIKALEEKYGVEYLIKAFKILKDLHWKNLKLLIVGGGTLKSKLEKLCATLQISDDVVFTGHIPFNEVVRYYNMLDVYIALSVSDSESFGVAVLEASACEKSVVVSNVGGLPEVVLDNETGFIVPARNEQAAAQAIGKLILNKELRKTMGDNGRKWVNQKYNWKDNIQQMIHIYRNLIPKKSLL